MNAMAFESHSECAGIVNNSKNFAQFLKQKENILFIYIFHTGLILLLNALHNIDSFLYSVLCVFEIFKMRIYDKNVIYIFGFNNSALNLLH